VSTSKRYDGYDDGREGEWYAPEVVRERIRKYRLGELVHLGYAYGTANLFKSASWAKKRAAGGREEEFQGTDGERIGPSKR